MHNRGKRDKPKINIMPHTAKEYTEEIIILIFWKSVKIMIVEQSPERQKGGIK